MNRFSLTRRKIIDLFVYDKGVTSEFNSAPQTKKPYCTDVLNPSSDHRRVGKSVYPFFESLTLKIKEEDLLLLWIGRERFVLRLCRRSLLTTGTCIGLFLECCETPLDKLLELSVI